MTCSRTWLHFGRSILYVEREGRVQFMQGHHLSADLFDMMALRHE